MLPDPATLYAIGAGLLSGGIAWGGVYANVKSIKAEQAEVKDTLEAHTAADLAVQIDMVDRLARIETKLDDLIGK